MIKVNPSIEALVEVSNKLIDKFDLKVRSVQGDLADAFAYLWIRLSERLPLNSDVVSEIRSFVKEINPKYRVGFYRAHGCESEDQCVRSFVDEVEVLKIEIPNVLAGYKTGRKSTVVM